MKALNKGYYVCGFFGIVGVLLYLIVIGEAIFNAATSPAWVTTLKILGLIAFCVALLSLILMVIISAIYEKKEAKKGVIKLSDEELLAKYKSSKTKK